MQSIANWCYNDDKVCECLVFIENIRSGSPCLAFSQHTKVYQSTPADN